MRDQKVIRAYYYAFLSIGCSHRGEEMTKRSVEVFDFRVTAGLTRYKAHRPYLVQLRFSVSFGAILLINFFTDAYGSLDIFFLSYSWSCLLRYRSVISLSVVYFIFSLLLSTTIVLFLPSSFRLPLKLLLFSLFSSLVLAVCSGKQF